MSGIRKLMVLLSGNGPTSAANRRREAAGQPRLLYRRPVPFGPQMHSPRRINALLAGLPSRSDYLEIGVFTGFTLQDVRAPHRVGVDPDPRFDVTDLPRGIEFHTLESDAYFAALDPAARFDVAFIDGLHTYEQTYRDLINALAHVRDGVILLDDTVPDDELTAIPDQAESLAVRAAAGITGLRWHGDVWKVVVAISRLHPELSYRTITNRGNGQTVVWRTSPDEPVATPSPAELEAIGALTYAEVLADGLPDWFNPMDEDAAIRAALAGTSGRSR